MQEIDFNLREYFQESRASLEKTWGLSFSIMMSGVFSRMIKDPTGEGYHALIDNLDSALMAPLIIILGIIVLLVSYYSEQIPSWMSHPNRFYFTMGFFLIISYLAGYLMYDSLLVAVSLAVLANGILTFMIMNKKKWGVNPSWIVSRFIDKE